MNKSQNNFVLEFLESYIIYKKATPIIAILVCLPMYLVFKIMWCFGFITLKARSNGTDTGEA
tara:strand:- start:110 stop:295 length:186 start_codon:yes stop_codon:yes gene_type:complete